MPGEKIKPGSTVNVYTEKVVVLVPSLIGMSADQAVAALKTAGLVMGSTIERPGPPEEQGKIVQQIPEAGTAADDGSSVSVIVGI
jgi:serine/threonine-protein kinase